MRAITPCFASLLFVTTAFAGGTAAAMPVDVVPLVGAYIPTGDQSKELKSSVLTAFEASYDLAGPLRMVGTVAWAPTRDKEYADARRNLYQYDAGVELASHREMWKVRPFVGAGLGARSMREKAVTTADQTAFEGYGSVGGSLERERLGARLELRDNVSRFKEVDEGTTGTRNDLMLAGGVTIRL